MTYRAYCVLEQDHSLSIVRDWNLATIWQTIELDIPATDEQQRVPARSRLHHADNNIVL